MDQRMVTEADLEVFRTYLIREEKSKASEEKYRRDVKAFLAFLAGRPFSKDRLIEYKRYLQECEKEPGEKKYRISSINSMLVAINRFAVFLGMESCRVRTLKMQRETYQENERHIRQADFGSMIKAEPNSRRGLIIQTIGATGIRVSELRYFTVKAVRRGKIVITSKGKTRIVFIPNILKKKLMAYAGKYHIECGMIFRTRYGNPINRSHIWADMKKVGAAAGVAAAKVFPYNLRRLFARAFYAACRDLSKLADVLGHSSINTTRIYIQTDGTEQMEIMNQLNLIPE